VDFLHHRITLATRALATALAHFAAANTGSTGVPCLLPPIRPHGSATFAPPASTPPLLTCPLAHSYHFRHALALRRVTSRATRMPENRLQHGPLIPAHAGCDASAARVRKSGSHLRLPRARWLVYRCQLTISSGHLTTRQLLPGHATFCCGTAFTLVLLPPLQHNRVLFFAAWERRAPAVSGLPTPPPGVGLPSTHPVPDGLDRRHLPGCSPACGYTAACPLRQLFLRDQTLTFHPYPPHHTPAATTKQDMTVPCMHTHFAFTTHTSPTYYLQPAPALPPAVTAHHHQPHPWPDTCPHNKCHSMPLNTTRDGPRLPGPSHAAPPPP